MSKVTVGMTTAALVALGTQALASVPSTRPAAQPTQSQIARGTTGISIEDLVVGLDGTIPLTLKSGNLKVAACAEGSANNHCVNYCCG